MSRSLVDVYDMLELFVSNIEVLGEQLFGELMLSLSADERKWSGCCLLELSFQTTDTESQDNTIITVRLILGARC